MPRVTVNWMAEERHFFMRLTRRPLNASAQALWHVLMNKANSSYWHFPLKIQTGELAAILGVSVTTIKTARAKLQQNGYILFSNGKGGRQPANYYLLSMVYEGQLLFGLPNTKAFEAEKQKPPQE
ncbi:helix-turn-helix domain-containing protein [Mitsuokella sp.]|uniref:helix-turn-helix domain-containing protein n=1 Tax=Mitsuokella sp. TaxID=2049034 RepID=UPI003D7D4C0F